MNDNMGPNGLAPSQLVLETMLTFPTSAHTNKTQTKRFRATALARSEMEIISTENQIKIAFRSTALPATYSLIRPGDKLHE